MVRQIKSTRFDEEESWDNMLKVYKDILEAYGLFEKKFEILKIKRESAKTSNAFIKPTSRRCVCAVYSS
ncbi:hypothetical protein HF086_006431 [Spodoptera exigua]|uniref:Uncharacterized protein n=1 Tax=Spodoptera exigua TaxID=7107 RepID=A0A922SPB5_SPOEX|nr:hypothetical protein HF086_006431 [Spodoptera exigua]